MTPQQSGHLAMLIFSALIAGSFSLGHMAAPHIDPVALNSIRFLLASVIVGSIAVSLGQLERAHLQAPWRYLILGGLFAVYFVTMFEALKTVSAVSTAAVFTLMPLIAAFVGRAVLGQRISPVMLFGLAVGAVGALWVIFRADLQAFLRFDVGYGEVLFFFGCIAHAIYPTASRIVSRGQPPFSINLGMLLAGLLLMSAWGWREILATDWLALPPIVWLTILYTAAVSGAITFTLLQYSSQRLPGGKVMAYTYLVPSWVILWELALGHDTPRALILVGVALTVVSLLILLAEGRNEAGHSKVKT